MIDRESVGDVARLGSCIIGDVDLTDWSASDLAAFGSVVRIVGNVSLRGGHARDLEGPRALQRIEGHLHLEANEQLETLAGLAALVDVAGSVTIANNPALIDLEGPIHLASVGLSLSIYACDNLRGTEDAFPSLADVEQVRISDNASLASVDLYPLQYVSRMEIEDNPRLGSIRLAGPTLVESALVIARNERLRSISASTIEGGASVAFLIHHNQNLETIDGFDGIARVGALVVSNNAELETVRAFSDLQHAMSIAIENNPALSFLGLDRLRRVDMALRVFGNTALGDESVAAIVGMIDAGDEKIGRNSLGWEPIDPCPWEGDGECDGTDASPGEFGGATRLCATDPQDCA